MKHWEPYVRAGWEMVMEAQGASKTYLVPDVEAFLVHTIARTIDRTDVWEEPIAIKMMTAQTKPGLTKRIELRNVGEEFLFIDAWEFKQRRWPSPNYFKDMGSIAFGMASVATRPIDTTLELVSEHFTTMSHVLRQVRDLHLHKK